MVRVMEEKTASLTQSYAVVLGTGAKTWRYRDITKQACGTLARTGCLTLSKGRVGRVMADVEKMRERDGKRKHTQGKTEA